MKEKGRIHLRNKIIAFLNGKASFGCKVHAEGIPGAKRMRGARARYFSRLITGVAKDGRMIVIYPFIHRRELIPRPICEYMREVEMRCGITGTASNIGDAYEIVADDPVEYPRKEKTKLHQYAMRKYEEKRNGRTEEE